jgi:hypothetical protein
MSLLKIFVFFVSFVVQMAFCSGLKNEYPTVY